MVQKFNRNKFNYNKIKHHKVNNEISKNTQLKRFLFASLIIIAFVFLNDQIINNKRTITKYYIRNNRDKSIFYSQYIYKNSIQQINNKKILSKVQTEIQSLMRLKNHIPKISFLKPKLTNATLKQSFVVSKNLLQELLVKVFKHLPPDPQTLLKYSGILMSQTTAKLVDVNMLQSQMVESQEETQQNLSFKERNESLFQSSYKQSKQKKFNSENQQFDISQSQFLENQDLKNQLQLELQKKKKSFRMSEDEEIHLRKDGIKFVKKQELKNLIKHRATNSHSSLHVEGSNQAIYDSNGTKKSLYEPFPTYKKGMMSSDVDQNIRQKPFTGPLMKSTKSFSTLPGVNGKAGIGESFSSKKRVSGLLNQSNFVNLKDFYKQKQQKQIQKKSKVFRKVSVLKENQNQNVHIKNTPSNFSTYVYQHMRNDSNSWLYENNGNQKYDQADVMINKLRERKQKFYRTGQNYSNGDSFTTTKRQNTMIGINGQQKSSGQNNQTGAMLAFDYSGEVMPTVKYDMLKIQQHYQDMDFVINQNDESMRKKKQRKAYMFRGAINLKLVDHQRFIPHPSYKFDPLVQKAGMLMRQNAAYMLKKGVQLRGRDQATNNSSLNTTVNDNQETKQRINKASFEFLYNEQTQPGNVKYQQFVKYKKAYQSQNQFHKGNSSRKKLFDMTNQSNNQLLSKKSIALKGLKKLGNQAQDVSNKVHRSQNRKALQMLINANQLNGNDLFGVDDRVMGSDMTVGNNGGVLKNGIHGHTKSMSSNNGDKNIVNQAATAKKKVRIA